MNDTLKHALIAILVGAIIAFISSLCQGLLNYFNHIISPTLGGISSTASYLALWKTNQIG